MWAGLIGQQERTAGTEIGIGMVERCLIVGSEVITDDDGGTLKRELKFGIAVIASAGGGVEGSVACCYEDISSGVGGGAVSLAQMPPCSPSGVHLILLFALACADRRP